MNILNRIGKMAEAAWQETAGKLEHQEGGSSVIEKLEQRYEEALQQTIELRQHIVNAEEMAQLRGEQAELAMRAGDEELARLALLEKQREEAACEHYRAQYASSQDVCLALADELRGLRAGHAAEGARVQPPGSGLHGKEARDAWRELEVTGRELGREALQGLREAGRLSQETLKEAGGNLQQELRTLRGKLQQDWLQHRSSDDMDPRGKK
ncbi:hypothetical protein HQN89_31735 [Paenibacillus frigoriresistens]|uniref:PspA/IM30 family protein n=1 Tax=Paenibacillus alginolyticus TaxID=59839 RepID=UPI001565D141|nr:hypothetical protein [Paenibacillus frigoriresistens]NRF95445.1 hypothetical protein [Paenibacillus frigoriresistens]